MAAVVGPAAAHLIQRASGMPTEMPGLPVDSLAHLLQHERGCTCAWVASGGALDDFESLVIQHRTQTSSLLNRPEQQAIKMLVYEPLMSLRSGADRVVVDSPKRTTHNDVAHAFYDCLAGYTNVIASVLDFELDIDSSSREPEGGAAAEESPRKTTMIAFNGLKEAMSIERAFVCGILSLPEAAIPHLPKRAFADFVLCMEKQRADRAAVRAAAPPAMLRILLAAFKLRPELEAIQEVLIKDFDVVRLRTLVRPPASILRPRRSPPPMRPSSLVAHPEILGLTPRTAGRLCPVVVGAHYQPHQPHARAAAPLHAGPGAGPSRLADHIAHRVAPRRSAHPPRLRRAHPHGAAGTRAGRRAGAAPSLALGPIRGGIA